MKRTIEDYIDDAVPWMLALICTPFFCIAEKIEYYCGERKRLLNEINHYHARIYSLEQELEDCLSKARSDREYYQSENDRLRRKLSSKGVSAKQLRK